MGVTIGERVTSADTVEQKPKILFIYLDDFGWKDETGAKRTFEKNPAFNVKAGQNTKKRKKAAEK